MKCHQTQKQEKGFTLIELLLSIIIIVAIVGFATPIYQNFQVKNDLNLAASTVVQTLRRAQVLSQASDGNSSWGVKLQAGSISLFQGNDYLSRNTNYDEVFELSNNIDSSSGIEEVVFTKFTGLPDTTGNVILTIPNGDTKTITINQKGMIEY